MFDILGGGRENMENPGKPKKIHRDASKQDFIIFRNKGAIWNQRIKIHQISNSGYLNERKAEKGVTLMRFMLSD